MFFVGSRQWLSLPHYRSRREANLVTLWEATQERSLMFLANPDSVMCLTTGAAATTSLFGMMTIAASVVAVSIATTVSSPISDSSDLDTLMIGIPSTTTTGARTTTTTRTIIPILTTDRLTMTGIRAISPWWYKPNLHGAATIAGRSMT